MPRGRMLNKKISLDQEVSKLSREANILYVWTLPHLDVDGKIHADPQFLKGNVCPYLNFMTIKVIEKCLIELGSTRLVVVYGDSPKYMKYLGFEKNQRVDRDREMPSEIPDPTPEQLQSNSRVTPDLLQSNSGVTPAKGKVSKGKVSTTEVNHSTQDFISSLKDNPAYKHIDIGAELGKMDAWLGMARNRHRKKTERFVLNWLNRIESPLSSQKPKTRIPC